MPCAPRAPHHAFSKGCYTRPLLQSRVASPVQNDQDQIRPDRRVARVFLALSFQIRKARMFSAFTPVKSSGVLGLYSYQELGCSRLSSARTVKHDHVSKPRISIRARTTALANSRVSHAPPPRASGQRADIVTACDVTTPRAHQSKRISKDSVVLWSKTEHRACALHATAATCPNGTIDTRANRNCHIYGL